MTQRQASSDFLTDHSSPAETAAWRQHDSIHGFADPLIEQIARRFHLLGEPLRLKLVAALSGGEQSVSDLVALTGASQPNVSKHLAALAQGGLVRRRKVGLVALYSIADPLVLRLCDVVCAGVQENIARQAQALGIQFGAAAGNAQLTQQTEPTR
ncbi:MAG TPA: metalloregulator ArsR/SmtB family transcription factor [Ktedonobacterales bacterium]|jgi:ArsR family transcriptional regulator